MRKLGCFSQLKVNFTAVWEKQRALSRRDVTDLPSCWVLECLFHPTCLQVFTSSCVGTLLLPVLSHGWLWNWRVCLSLISALVLPHPCICQPWQMPALLSWTLFKAGPGFSPKIKLWNIISHPVQWPQQDIFLWQPTLVRADDCYHLLNFLLTNFHLISHSIRETILQNKRRR